jgi:IS5 family transposase
MNVASCDWAEELKITARHQGHRSSSDELTSLIDWTPIAPRFDDIHSAAKDEPARPRLALFMPRLISMWHDIPDLKLAEARDDRVCFGSLFGFSSSEATPERSTFVRFREQLVARDVERPGLIP